MVGIKSYLRRSEVEVFGEIATLNSGAATATVTTAVGCTLLFLAKESVQTLMTAVPSIRGLCRGAWRPASSRYENSTDEGSG